MQDVYVFLSSFENKFKFLMKTFQQFSPYSELQWTPNGWRQFLICKFWGSQNKAGDGSGMWLEEGEVTEQSRDHIGESF